MYITPSSIKELAFTPGIAAGSKGITVKRLQEWLNLHGNGVVIDNDFGPATQAAVKNFQNSQGLPTTGVLTAQTWKALIKPMNSALTATVVAGSFADDACLAIARAHLAVHPMEAGGDNCGPWVRLYTGGNSGADWLWCAGFVSFVTSQACDLAALPRPIKGSLSCDTLASQAQLAKRFVSGKSLGKSATASGALGACALFLLRRTPGDWSHTGLAYNFTDSTFDTIEGNTNDEGGSNGYEVCHRTRKFDDNKDFITLH